MNTKPILAYDCACAGATVALRVNGNTHSVVIGNTQQAAELVPAIDALLKKYGVSYADLGVIITTTGPGSFTGVRIGLATLQGLVLTHRTPIKLLTTLEAIAWQASREANCPEEFIVTLRAGKGQVYAQLFALETTRPVARDIITLEPETKNDWPTPVINTLSSPDAAAMCGLTSMLPDATLADALPVYVRPPDAAVPEAYPWLKTK